jgi:hypothetical protein
MTTAAQKKIDEKFDASFGVNASVPDPVGAGDSGANRSADNSAGPEPMHKSAMIQDMVTKAYSLSSAQLAPGYAEFMKIAASGGGSTSRPRDVSAKGDPMVKSSGMKEDLDLAFAGSELTEEFKNTAATIFEAAIESQLIARKAALDEEYEGRFATELEEAVSSLKENVDKYLDFVVQEWAEENRLAIESGIRSDIMENFMSGLKDLFVEHYIDIPEDKVDVVESLTAKVSELEESLNEAQNEQIELQAKINEATAASIVEEVSKGMTATQADQLKSLVESVDFSDEESYKEKVTTIAEGYVNKKGKVDASAALNEEVPGAGKSTEAGTVVESVVDPMVAMIAQSIKKNVGR